MQPTNQPPHPANNDYAEQERILMIEANITVPQVTVYYDTAIDAMTIYADQQKQQIIQIIEDRIAELEEELSTCTHESVKAELKIEIGAIKNILKLIK